MSDAWVSWANVVAGFAALGALIYSIVDRYGSRKQRKADLKELAAQRKADLLERDRLRAEDDEKRRLERETDIDERESARKTEVAQQVFAWAVRESTGDPAELHSAPTGTRSITTLARGGLVLKNLSQDVALKVDIVTKWRETAKSPSLADDEFSPQRFALIPPGTYYIQQRPSASRGNGETAWSAPIPLDDSSGRLVVDLRDPGDEESREVTLLPLTFVPEDKRVAFLRFWVAGREWHRDADGALIEKHGTNQWDEKLEKSETEVLTAGSRKRTYNPDVADAVQRLFRYFTEDTWRARTPLKVKEGAPRQEFVGDFVGVKMPGSLGTDQEPATTQTLRLSLQVNPAYELSIEGSGTKGKVASKVEILGPNKTKREVVRSTSFGRLPKELDTDDALEDYAKDILIALKETLQNAPIPPA